MKKRVRYTAPVFFIILAMFFTMSISLSSVQSTAKELSPGDKSLLAQSSDEYEEEYIPENTDQPETDNQYNPDESTEEIPYEGSEDNPEAPTEDK